MKYSQKNAKSFDVPSLLNSNPSLASKYRALVETDEVVVVDTKEIDRQIAERQERDRQELQQIGQMASRSALRSLLLIH